MIALAVTLVVLGVLARDVAVRYLAHRAAGRTPDAADALAVRVARLEATVGEAAGEGPLGRRVVVLERAAAARVRR